MSWISGNAGGTAKFAQKSRREANGAKDSERERKLSLTDREGDGLGSARGRVKGEKARRHCGRAKGSPLA